MNRMLLKETKKKSKLLGFLGCSMLFCLVWMMSMFASIDAIAQNNLTIGTGNNPTNIVPFDTEAKYQFALTAPLADNAENIVVSVLVPKIFDVMSIEFDAASSNWNGNPVPSDVQSMTWTLGAANPSYPNHNVYVSDAPITELLKTTITTYTLTVKITECDLTHGDKKMYYSAVYDMGSSIGLGTIANTTEINEIIEPEFVADFTIGGDPLTSLNVNEVHEREWAMQPNATDFYAVGFKVEFVSSPAVVKNVKFEYQDNNGNYVKFSNVTTTPTGYSYIIDADIINAVTGRTDGKLLDAEVIFIKETIFYNECYDYTLLATNTSTISYNLWYGDAVIDEWCPGNVTNNLLLDDSDLELIEPLFMVAPINNIDIPQIKRNVLQKIDQAYGIMPISTNNDFYTQGYTITKNFDFNGTNGDYSKIIIDSVFIFDPGSGNHYTLTGLTVDGSGDLEYTIDTAIINKLYSTADGKIMNGMPIFIAEFFYYEGCIDDAADVEIITTWPYFTYNYETPGEDPSVILSCDGNSVNELEMLVDQEFLIFAPLFDVIAGAGVVANDNINPNDIVTRAWELTVGAVDPGYYVDSILVEMQFDTAAFELVSLSIDGAPATISYFDDGATTGVRYYVSSARLLDGDDFDIEEKLRYKGCADGTDEVVSYLFTYMYNEDAPIPSYHKVCDGNPANGLVLISTTYNIIDAGFDVTAPVNLLTNLNEEKERTWSIELASKETDPLIAADFYVKGLKIEITSPEDSVKLVEFEYEDNSNVWQAIAAVYDPTTEKYTIEITSTEINEVTGRLDDKLINGEIINFRETLKYIDCRTEPREVSYKLFYSYGDPDKWCEGNDINELEIDPATTVDVYDAKFDFTNPALLVEVNLNDVIERKYDISLRSNLPGFLAEALKIEIECDTDIVKMHELEMDINADIYAPGTYDIILSPPSLLYDATGTTVIGYQYIITKDNIATAANGSRPDGLNKSDKLFFTERMYYADCEGKSELKTTVYYGIEDGVNPTLWCDTKINFPNTEVGLFEPGFILNPEFNDIIEVHGKTTPALRDWNLTIDGDANFIAQGLLVQIKCDYEMVDFVNNKIYFGTSELDAESKANSATISYWIDASTNDTLGYQFKINTADFGIFPNLDYLAHGETIYFYEEMNYLTCEDMTDMGYFFYFTDDIYGPIAVVDATDIYNNSLIKECENGFNNGTFDAPNHAYEIRNTAVKLEFEDLSIKGFYLNTTHERLEIKGKIRNTNRFYDLMDVDGGNNAIMQLFLNNDGSGNAHSSSNIELTTGLYGPLPYKHVNPILKDSATEFTWVVDVESHNICKLILAIEVALNPGVCEDVYESDSLKDVKYEVVYSEKSVCQGSDLYIGEEGVVGYIYSWTGLTADSKTTYLNRTDVSNPTFKFPTVLTEPDTLEYKLTIDRRNGNCSPEFAEKIFTIIVNPIPTVDPIFDIVLCNDDDFAKLLFTGTANTEFRWNRKGNSGNIGMNATNGVDSIPAFTANNTTSSPITVTYQVTPVFIDAKSYYECVGATEEFTITVYPTPILISATGTVASICSGETFTYQATSNVPGVQFSWLNKATGTTGNSAVINEVLTNTTSAELEVTYIITMVQNGAVCKTPVEDSIKVKVNPAFTFALTKDDLAVCSDEASASLAYTKTGAATLKYTIEYSAAALTAGFVNVAETLLPSSPIAISVAGKQSGVYTGTIKVYTDGNETCSVSKSFTVTVVEKPAINAVSDMVYCHGENVLPLAFSGTPTNLTITWNQTSTTGITGIPATGSGSMPAFTAVNTTNSDITATYTLTMVNTLNGKTCNSVSAPFTIDVKPQAKLATVADERICSGEKLNVTFIGTNSTSVTWERVSGSVIPGLAANGTDNIVDLTLTNLTSSAITATYRATAHNSANCEGQYQDFEITVYPKPTLTSATGTVASICSGETFTYQATSNVPGVQFSWKNNVTNTTGNTSVINEVLTNATSSELEVTYTITMVQNGVSCVTPVTETIKVLVNPAFTFALTKDDLAVCSDEAKVFLAYTKTGAATLKYTIEYSAAAQTAGFANVAETTLPNGSVEISVAGKKSGVYTGTINVYTEGNETCSVSKSFTVTVVEKPAINTVSNMVYCHGENVSPLAFSGTPTNLTITWNQTSATGITGIPATGSGSMPAFTAANTTNSDIVATYTLTMANIVNGKTCDSVSAPFTITVKPQAQVTTVADAFVCNNSALNITFTGNNSTKFEWARVSGSVITGLNAYGNGNITNATLTNATKVAQTATYKVIAFNGECEGRSQEFDITVYPTADLTSATNAGSICSGETFVYEAVSDVLGATISWTRTAQAGNLAASGNNASINETLINNTASPVDVEYVIKLSNSATCFDTKTVKVKVNPEFDFALTKQIVAECYNETSTKLPYARSAANTNLAYTIKFSPEATAAGFVNATGTITAIFGDIAINIPAGAPAYTYAGTIVVSVVGGNNNCTIEEDFAIIINPSPIVNEIHDVEYCHGTLAPEMIFTGRNSSVDISWKKISGDDIVGLASSGHGSMPAFTALNNGTTDLVATYEVTMSYTYAGKVCDDSDDFKITILPQPRLDHVANTEICSGDALSILFKDSDNISTKFEWSRVRGDEIPGIGAHGVGNINVAKIVNPTLYTLNATYRVTAYKGSCEGVSQEFDITVYPTPELTSSTDDVNICSGERFIYNATSNVPGSEFTWESKDASGNVLSSGNSGYINEVLTNDTDAQIVVTYTIKITQNSNCEATQDIKVLVNPMPSINIEYRSYTCWNASKVKIAYTTSQSTPKEYKLTFDSDAYDAGFRNINTFTQLPSSLYVTLPKNAPAGLYYGTITIKTYTCTYDYPIAIEVNAPIAIIEHPESIIGVCDSGLDIDLSVYATGDSLEYQWYHNGAAIQGATDSRYIAAYSEGLAGEYYVEVSNMCETVRSNVAEIVPNNITIDLMWENVLVIDNKKGPFVSYQWYKDGAALSGETHQYYTERNGLDGTYYVVCFYADGTSIESCPRTFVAQISAKTSVFPNPAKPNNTVNVEADINMDIDNAYIQLVDNLGRVLVETKVTGRITEINTPNTPATYLIKVVYSTEDKVETKRLLVK